MNELKRIIAWAQLEEQKLIHLIPAVVKQYGNEALHICETIKAALAKPQAVAIETALEQMLPAVWVPTVIAALSKALGTAIPLLTNVEAHADATPTDQAEALIAYLQAQSPKMQHAGLLKLLSSIFMSIDPSLTEIEADTAAQTAYAHSTIN